MYACIVHVNQFMSLFAWATIFIVIIIIIIIIITSTIIKIIFYTKFISSIGQ